MDRLHGARTPSRVRGRGALALTALAGALTIGALHPATSHASGVSVSGNTLTYVADPGETNQTTVGRNAAGTFVVVDPGAAITPGTGCTLPNAADVHRAQCAGAITLVTVSGGDKDDKLTMKTATRGVLGGGAGRDTLLGHAADDTLNGGADDDVLDGGSGGDILDGAAGAHDRVTYANRTVAVSVFLDANPNDGEPGEHDTVKNVDEVTTGSGDDFIDVSFATADANTIDGGPGIDTVSYQQRPNGTLVSLDGLANDGTGPNEKDNILPTVENLRGGPSSDIFAGSAAANVLFGNGGIDLLVGGPGPDLLNGGSDGDILNGGDDADTLDGSAGDDQLAGEGGDDLLDGNSGADQLSGGPGIDTATYAARVQPVLVTIDDASNDGQANEKDNVRKDVENLIGGSAADTLLGQFAPGVIDTAAGTFEGRDGDDELGHLGGNGPFHLIGGRGDDTLHSGNADDVLEGGDGKDELTAGRGTNKLDGGPDDDTLDGGRFGHDELNGGTGTDTVDYSAHGFGVTVTIDDIANDGETGENDDVHTDVENVNGSNAVDDITGSNLANRIFGGIGADTLTGGLGHDTIDGGPDTDLDTIDALDGVSDTVICAPPDSVSSDPIDSVTGC